MKKILIPVDFEDELTSVYKFVEKLSANQPIHVTLLHVLQYPVAPGNYLSPADYITEFYDRFRKAQEQQLADVGKLKFFAQCAEVETKLLGEPGAAVSETIPAVAAEGGYDLLVLVSKHRSGLNSMFVGSELVRTVRHSAVPIVVLSPDRVPTFNRVVFATDFSEASAKTYAKLREVAELLGIRIHCFYVNTMTEFKDQRQFVEARNQFINKIGLADLPEIQMYNAWELESGILNYADDHAADFIGLATHGRKGLGALFFNSLTETLLNDTTYPLIILNMRTMI